ncbi:MAG TPA: zinc-binding dehydrogenase [Kofleriaceae bacterium]|nr:zinc-binding dehydrogenase [Kofleriaceae bacterium]
MDANLRAVMRRHGPPSLIELVEDEAPRPGPGEVRIRVETAGVSPADLLIGWGLHPEARRAPFTPGWDVIGLVDATGDGVRLGTGQRVAALTIVGGFSRFVVVPERYAVPVPAGLDPSAAQCLPLDFIVGYQMLHRMARPPRGATALVQGAAGSIGGALLQLGRLEGLALYGTASARGRVYVESHGAAFIDYRRDDFLTEVRRAGGVDASFDGLGYTLWRSARALRRGGVVVAYGHASSVMGGKRDWRLFANILAQYGAVFAGAAVRRWRAELYSIQTLLRAHPDWYREDLTALFDLLGRGLIAPRVFRTLPLADVRDALQQVSDGVVEGKIILRVSS